MYRRFAKYARIFANKAIRHDIPCKMIEIKCADKPESNVWWYLGADRLWTLGGPDGSG